MARAKTQITDVVSTQPPQTPEAAGEIQVYQPVEQSTLMLFEGNPVKALLAAEDLVKHMAAKCGHLVLDLRGKKYPLVEWWTTVGSGLGLFPVEVSSTRLNRDGEIVYEAVVEVRRHGQVVTRASAIASNKERSTWANNEFSVKSMATTRAVGKAYRLPLGWLARLAGLEPTPADEMAHDDGTAVANQAPASARPVASMSGKAASAPAVQKRDDLDDTGEAEFDPVECVLGAQGQGKFGPWELWILKTAQGPQFGSLNKKIVEEMKHAAETGSRSTIRWKRTPKGGLDCVAIDIL